MLDFVEKNKPRIILKFEIKKTSEDWRKHTGGKRCQIVVSDWKWWSEKIEWLLLDEI